ncbi:hypothetical protein SLEP1_g27872 [Rubroshorea leprosula]|uniref:Uncharacterized protein n=1 Tax=Rubroshorea leprosula TaxID=152421 RepID=A0AAV5K0I8_9ROSI|nr:hypothetical protein SLEP1_g27872 [Rubroshorea leprosula]
MLGSAPEPELQNPATQQNPDLGSAAWGKKKKKSETGKFIITFLKSFGYLWLCGVCTPRY